MSAVEFEEDNFTNIDTMMNHEPTKPSGATAFLIKHNLAKNEKAASYILLSMAATLIVAALMIVLFALKKPSINYNIRPEILQTLPNDIKNNITNANK